MRRLNPRSRDVRIRVLRSNPVGGFTVAEIVALSKYPGKGPAQPRIKQAMAEASRQFTGSEGFFRPKSKRKRGPPDHYEEWELFDYQKAGVAYVLEQAAKGQRRTAIFDPMGLGKAQPLDAKVLTPTGWVEIGSLSVGDLVIDPDTGEGVPVTGVFPQGRKEVFRVSMSDGSSTRCCKEHLWHVQTPDQRYHTQQPGPRSRNRWKTPGHHVLELQEMEEKGFSRKVKRRGKTEWQSRFFLPVTKPVQYKPNDLSRPLLAYLFGALLGDGSFRGNSISFSSVEPELLGMVERLLPEGVVLSPKGGDDYTLSAGASKKGPDGRLPGGGNPVLNAVRDLGLFGLYSEEKHIPESYLLSSVDDRLGLLRGLMDTDGDVTKGGVCTFNTSSPRLRDGVVSLVRSLGGVASVGTRIPKYEYKGEVREGKEAYRVNVRLCVNPFSLLRKKERWKEPRLIRSIRSAESEGKAECVCISVASRQSLYITDGFIVTHNTAQGVGAAVALGWEAMPVVVVAPLSAHNAWRDAFDVFSMLDVKKKNVFPGRGSPKKAVYLLTYDAVRKFENGLNHEVYTPPGLVIFDEAHMVGNPGSAQARGAATLIHDAKYTLLLTGTPALQSAFDVLPLLRYLDPAVRPFQTRQQYQAAAADWAADRGVRTVKPKGSDRLLLVSPEDGSLLEHDLRQKAVRRSRRSVVDVKAAPDKKLQRLKKRYADMVPLRGPYASASEEKLQELMLRQTDEGGLSDFAALGTARSRYRRLVDLLASSATSARDLFEKSQTRELSKEGELVRVREEWEEDVLPKGATVPFQAVMTQARGAYLPIPAGESDASSDARVRLRQMMGQHVIDRAVQYQQNPCLGLTGKEEKKCKAKQAKQDIVFVVYYQQTADLLGDKLIRADPSRKVYIYAGHKKGTFVPSGPRAAVRGVYKPGLKIEGKWVAQGEVLESLEQLFKTRQEGRKGRTVILTKAAMTGLSLPSADTLVFLDRYSSPGQEDQMEDRINRAGREGEPRIVYLIPEDIWGFVLAHRMANRRASIFSVFGERFAGVASRSDREALKRIGDDYATPLALQDAEGRVEHLRRLGTPEARAEADVIENTQFIEDPIGNLRKMAARAYRPVVESARAHQEAADRATRKRERKHQEAQAALSSQPTTQMSKFLHDIGAGKLTWWVIETRGGQKVFAVTADWPESNEEWVINVKGTVITVEDTNWYSTDEAVTSPTDLTEAQRNRLLEMGYERQGIKFNPSRRRPRRRPRWRRRDRWQ